MNREPKSPADTDDERAGANNSGQKTPSTDMQPEDTGTSDSGATGLGVEAEERAKRDNNDKR